MPLSEHARQVQKENAIKNGESYRQRQTRERKERYAAITKLIREGHTGPNISKLLGVSVRMVDRARADAGLSTPARHIPESDYDKARDLLEDGCSYAEASRTVGISISALSVRFPLLGWSNGRDGKSYDGRSVEYVRAIKSFNRLGKVLGDTKGGSKKTDKFITG